MDLERIFSAATYFAVFGWLVMVLMPRNPTAKIIGGIIVPLFLCAGYLILIAQHLPGAPGGFDSLADVATLMQTREVFLASWIHYLAFDLFIGAWEIRDSQRHGIPHLVILPCLLMTLLLGPIGLLFYFAIRTAKIRALKLDEA
jgi:hypothetical protein